MNIIVIGAGPAGVTAVETLRTYDKEAAVTMLSAEPYRPYSPPALADHFIYGTNAHFWREPDWAERLGVDYQAGVRVTAVDPDGRIYVVDAIFDTVQIFDRNGEFLLNFGSSGTRDGMFWLPTGIYVDDNYRIYVSDSYNKRLQVFEYLGDKVDVLKR